MSEKLEILEQQLDLLNQQRKSLLEEQHDLIENSPEVRRYIRLNFEERKLEKDILNINVQINKDRVINCNHTYINTCNDDLYCIKCGHNTFPDYIEESGIYKKTKGNFEIINTRYACDETVITKICNYIVGNYPYISEDEFAHFVAVAIHNMQTKRKSYSVKRNRAKRLYLRPSFLEKSNML